jgi:hypothetical protein
VYLAGSCAAHVACRATGIALRAMEAGFIEDEGAAVAYEYRVAESGPAIRCQRLRLSLPSHHGCY